MASKPTRKEKEKGKALETKMDAATPELDAAHEAESQELKITTAVVTALEPKLTRISDQINSVQASLTDLGYRLDMVEGRLGVTEETVLQLEGKIAVLEKSAKQCDDKLDELENRSRRSNLRFVGFPESIPEQQLLTTLEPWLTNVVLGPEHVGQVILERAHRLGPRSDGNQRPRVVIAKLLNYAQKILILQAYRKKKDILYDNKKILIFQDFSTKVSGQRKAFAGVCTDLVRRQIRFALQYPAKLRIWHHGESHLFEAASAAAAFVNSIPREEGTQQTPG